jgi:hypothetical protein
MTNRQLRFANGQDFGHWLLPVGDSRSDVAIGYGILAIRVSENNQPGKETD